MRALRSTCIRIGHITIRRIIIGRRHLRLPLRSHRRTIIALRRRKLHLHSHHVLLPGMNLHRQHGQRNGTPDGHRHGMRGRPGGKVMGEGIVGSPITANGIGWMALVAEQLGSPYM